MNDLTTELVNNPVTILGIAYAVNEIAKHVKNRNNFGLTTEEKKQLQYLYDMHNKHHEASMQRQEKMVQMLDEISANMLKMSIVLDAILNKLNK